MRSRRLALVAVVLGSALPAVPATAAPKKPLPCHQVSDDEGDGRTNPVGLDSPALDVLSADVSTGRNEVTAILRLKGTAVENDNALRLGAGWNFNISVAGTGYSFFAKWPSAAGSLSPKLYGGLTAGSNPSTPAATFRREGNTFIWTVSRAAIPGLKKPKTYITVTSANSGANSLSADSAFAKPNTKYLDKTPTCLPSK